MGREKRCPETAKNLMNRLGRLGGVFEFPSEGLDAVAGLRILLDHIAQIFDCRPDDVDYVR